MARKSAAFEWLDRIGYFDVLTFLLLAVLAWAPFPVGSDRPLWTALLACLVGILLILWALGALIKRPNIKWPPSVVAAFLLFTGVLVWSWLQQVTWLPDSWNSPVWELLNGTAIDYQPRISINAATPLAAIMKLGSVMGVFGLCFLLASREHRAKWLLYGLLTIFVAYALLGLGMFITGYRPWNELVLKNLVTSTIINRNHFATYANMGIILALVLIFVGRYQPPSHLTRLKAFFIRLIAEPIERSPFAIMALVFLSIALLGTLSRGGFLSLACGVLVFLVIQLRGRKLSEVQLLVSLASFVAVFGIIVWGIGGPLIERFDDIQSEIDVEGSGRMAAWKRTVEMIEAQPWFGYGHGSFYDLFMMNTNPQFIVIFNHAHNDYLEAMAELGLPAAFAILLAFALLVLRCNKMAVRGRLVQRQAALVALLACVVVGVHALFDFSLIVPAVSTGFAALLGIGCAANSAVEKSRRSSRNSRERDEFGAKV